ncbi:MAG: Epimerase family protein [Chlamydiae bacterium]|nr:Epimerase family protein [Chlamydiota bacterium]
MKIVLAGGSGFIGTHLVSHFQKRGDELILLSHSKKEGTHFWDPEKKQIDPSLLDGADVVINLAGESILGRWNQEKMEKIRESRFSSTRFLCETLLTQPTLPKFYLNASAVGFYGDRGEEVLTEMSSSGHGYLSEVCRTWESIPNLLEEQGVRVAFARFGLVLGRGGGALEKMEKPFRMGMGGTLGSGKQYMSWIAIEDVIGGIDHLIAHTELSGPVNFVAPSSITNKEFTEILAKTLHKPSPIPIPKFLLSMIFGSGAEVFLASLRAHPERLLKSGYTFQYPDLGPALEKYLHRKEEIG